MVNMHAVRTIVVLSVLVVGSGQAAAQMWQDATADCIGTTAGWTNKVEVADVDGDGLVDILMANGGDYDTPGTAEPTRIWRNLGNWATAGTPHCTEISAEAIGGFSGLARVIKVADLDGDGDLDIVTGGAYQTQLRMFVRDGTGWTDATAKLPQQPTSVGDLEFGDVDGDGDLDMLIGDWGATPPGANNYQGGRTRLYLNDGTGAFTEAAANLPATLVAWTWDVELVDVDNDWDLDALVSCKLCANSFVFRNDGTGHFTEDATAIPRATNNYEFEPMDIDGDGDLDLATINDGGQLRDRLLVNDGTGTFTDGSARLGSNPSADDNIAVWLDVDSDGDADLLIGSLGTDRLLLNDGAGNFTLAASATPNDTRATLGLAAADLDGDGRLDLVQGQGESAFPDKIQLASAAVAADTAPPVVRADFLAGRIVARVHDHQSPSRAHDWRRVWAETASGEVELAWYGEYLWRSPAAPAPALRVCAIDRAGNQGCSDMAVGGDDTVPPDGGGIEPPGGGGGGCCDSGSAPAGLLLPLAFVLLAWHRRRW